MCLCPLVGIDSSSDCERAHSSHTNPPCLASEGESATGTASKWAAVAAARAATSARLASPGARSRVARTTGERGVQALERARGRGATTHIITAPEAPQLPTHPAPRRPHANATPRGPQAARQLLAGSQPARASSTFLSHSSLRARTRRDRHRTLRDPRLSGPLPLLDGLRQHAAAAAATVRRGRVGGGRQQEGAEAVHHHQVAGELDGAGARQVPRGPAAVSRPQPVTRSYSPAAVWLMF